MIHGRDQADAQRKLEQMYRHCRIVDCRPMALVRLDNAPLEEITASVVK